MIFRRLMALVLATGLASAFIEPAASAANAASAVEGLDVAGRAVDTSATGDAAAGKTKAVVCGACHGMDSNATDAQYPKLAGQFESYTVQQLQDFKSGKRLNPIMLGMSSMLSVQDMRDIGAYFASQRVKPAAAVGHASLATQGGQLYRQGDAVHEVPACMACHARNGRGNPGVPYPSLAGQHAAYVQARLKAWHDQSITAAAPPGPMSLIAKQLDDSQISALANYIESLRGDNP